MHWYLGVLKNYRGFSGRARRTEYWMFALFHALALLLLQLLMVGIITTGVVTQAGPPLLWIIAAFAPYLAYAIGTFVPSLAVVVRRLHDTGRSGWWCLMMLIPYAGPIVMLIFFVQEGEPYENRYGPSPKPVPYFPMAHQAAPM